MDPDSPAFSPRCYGYDRNDEEGLILNFAEARIVLKIFDWYEQGWSIVRIKKELEALKIPTPTGKMKWPVKTIENILTNESIPAPPSMEKQSPLIFLPPREKPVTRSRSTLLASS